MKPGYWRVLAKTLWKYPQVRSRAEWWAFRSAGAFPCVFLAGFLYWFPGGLPALIATTVSWLVLQALIGTWWLHEGRDRYPLSATAIERIHARADRKQRRHERRVEKWRVTPSM